MYNLNIKKKRKLFFSQYLLNFISNNSLLSLILKVLSNLFFCLITEKKRFIVYKPKHKTNNDSLAKPNKKKRRVYLVALNVSIFLASVSKAKKKDES